MPTYENRCPEGHEFELMQKMSDRPRAKCPVCGRPAVRQISGGAGLIFKGSGFYITDYGKDGKGPRTEKETDAKVPETPAPTAESAPKTEKPEQVEKREKPEKVEKAQAASKTASKSASKSARKKPKP
jgi:putative FmdB family regulatory protein